MRTGELGPIPQQWDSDTSLRSDRHPTILLVFTIGEKKKVHKGFVNSTPLLRNTKQRQSSKKSVPCDKGPTISVYVKYGYLALGAQGWD